MTLAAKPRYARLSDALSVALVVAVVGGAAVGLTRYNDARDHRRAVEREVGATVDALASQVAAGGVDVARTGLDGMASVHVATVGGTDEFGIAVGSEVVVARLNDVAATPKDAEIFHQTLLNRSAEFESYHERQQPIPKDRRFAAAQLDDPSGHEFALFAAFAPVIVDGSYTAMVRVSKRVLTPPPSVSGGFLGLMILVAFLLGLAVSWLPGAADPTLTASELSVGETRRRLGSPSPYRLGMMLAAGLPLVFLLLGQDTTLILAAAIFGAVVAFAVCPGTATLFRGIKEQPKTYLYVVPAMIGMVILVFVPFVMGVAISFFSDGEFTGIDNFAEILDVSGDAHPTFYWTTGVTVLWTVLNIILHVSIGMALALVLNRPKLRGKALYRVLLIVPWAVPNYITALIWKSMFNTQFGAVNGLLDVVGIEPVNWIGPGSSFATNFLANLTTNTWLGFPFMMVVTLGALQSIPQDLYEAADIDGAGRWQKFRQVTLPLLKPALVPAIILGTIWTFNMFNVIYLVSGGAPENETNILITEAYHAFKVLNRFGLAAAYSLLIFFFLLSYGWFTNKITGATEGAFE